MIDDRQSFHGEVRATVFDGDLAPDRVAAVMASTSQPEWMRLVSQHIDHNLVTNVGRQQMTKIIVAESTALASNIGLSTAVIVPALTDSALPSEKSRQPLTLYQSINTYEQRYVGYFSTISFGSTGINSCGLFDTATTGGNMWADALITVSKTTTQSLTVEWRIRATTG